VHDGVDADGADELADQRVANVELQKVGTPKILVRLLGVDADDILDVWHFDQALDEICAPPPSDARYEHSTFAGRHEFLFITLAPSRGGPRGY
jgi:hypothetical protein